MWVRIGETSIDMSGRAGIAAINADPMSNMGVSRIMVINLACSGSRQGEGGRGRIAADVVAPGVLEHEIHPQVRVDVRDAGAEQNRTHSRERAVVEGGT